MFFKILIGLLLGNVLLRSFTNGLGLLPKVFNVIDIPLVLVICAVALFQGARARAPFWTRSIHRRVVLFTGLVAIGVLSNLHYFYGAAIASQLAMLLLPLILFVAIVNLPFTTAEILRYGEVLWKLVILELVIGLLQLPGRIASGESEDVHGTFTGNAEQYAAFLVIGIFYLIGKSLVDPANRRRCIFLISATVLLIISIDNKASWLGLTCSLALVLARLDILKGRLIRIAAPFVFIVVFGTAIAFIARQTSGSISKFSGLAEAVKTDNVRNLGKIKAYYDIARLYAARPVSTLVGAGLSNFYSRASMLFYLDAVGLEKMYSNPGSLKETTGSDAPSRASSSMAGVLSKTLREPYYLRFYTTDEQIFAIGSGQVDTPFSPYAGLLGETGLLGFALYVSIYVTVLRRIWAMTNRYDADPRIFPMLTASTGFLIYVICNSIYGPFMETTRYTTILWSMLGLVFLYYQHAAAAADVSDQVESAISEIPQHGTHFQRGVL